MLEGKKKEVFSFVKGWGKGRQNSHFSKLFTSITGRYKFSSSAPELDAAHHAKEEMQVPEHTQLCEVCGKSCPIGPKEKDAT